MTITILHSFLRRCSGLSVGPSVTLAHPVKTVGQNEVSCDLYVARVTLC